MLTASHVDILTHINTGCLYEYVLTITRTIKPWFSSLQPSSHWQVSNQGHKRRDNFVRWKAPPPDIYLRSVWFNVRALLGHIHSCGCAQQGKSTSPLRIWGGFRLFWSSLHQAGVKIGVFIFSSGLLKVHLISRAHIEMVQRKQFNSLSGQMKNQAFLK